jgi:hypothetical protein
LGTWHQPASNPAKRRHLNEVIRSLPYGIQLSMDRIHFPPGEEPRVLTANLCEEVGDCALCPGIARAGDLELEGEDPEEWVFCTHECHKKQVVM